MKPYYYVNRVNGHGPTVKHPTAESAHMESLRLAEKHKGEVFEILVCIGITRTVQSQTFWMDGIMMP